MVFDTAAMSSVSVLRLLAQFVAVPILARLLSPADYGVVGMAMPFILFAMMIADAGIGMSLVRVPASERRVWSTCFWLSAALGLVLAAIMAALSPLAAYLFNEPRLGPIVMTLTLVVFAQAVSAIPGAALQQQHKFKLIAVIEIVATIVGIIAAIVVGLRGGGAWALVAQQLVFYLMRFVLTYRLSAFRPLYVYNYREVAEHLTFGRDVLSVNILNFFARSLDNLVIGKVISAAAVGIYSMALQFARLPGMLVSGPLQFVLYPRLSERKNDPAAIRATFLIVTRVLAIMIFPTMGMVAAAHYAVFTLLLSAKWAVSGKLFMIVAASCAVNAVTSLSATVLLALGRTDIRIRTTIEFGGLWLASLLVSVWFGLEWVAIAFNLATLAYTPRTVMLLLPHIGCKNAEYWRTMLTPSIATAGAIALFWEAKHSWLLGSWAQLFLAAFLSLLAIAVSVAKQHRFLRDELTLWRSLHR